MNTHTHARDTRTHTDSDASLANVHDYVNVASYVQSRIALNELCKYLLLNQFRRRSQAATSAAAAASVDDKNKRQAAWAIVQTAARRADTLGRGREGVKKEILC